jgi:hypothetical protein
MPVFKNRRFIVHLQPMVFLFFYKKLTLRGGADRKSAPHGFFIN